MRIGIIGSGIAGLVASRMLHDAGHQVTLFERQNAIGMDAHSLDIAGAQTSKKTRIDVPSRMFNATQWPDLFELYDELGVESVEVCASQSFSEFGGKTYLKLDQANRPVAFAGTLLARKARRILQEARRLQKQGVQDIDDAAALSRSTCEYLGDGKYDDEFIYEFLYPTLSSTVCTCSYRSLDNYPSETVLSILHNLTRDATLLRTKHGTRDVVNRLLDEPLDSHDPLELRLGCEVRSATTSNGEVELALTDGSRESFEHLVCATQANTALHLLPALNDAEASVLSSFTYEPISIFVHTDTSFMPAREHDWSTFNMQVSQDRREAMCTVWLNRFHADSEIAGPLFQSINAFSRPDPSQTLSQCVLQRPVVNRGSLAAWESIARMNQEPERTIWFCGSYASRGTPLLESGVVSAKSVVESISRKAAKTP